MNTNTNRGISLEEKTLVDRFVSALITDAHSPEPALKWEFTPGKTEQDHEVFTVNGFAGTNAKIVLTANNTDEKFDSYTLTYYRGNEKILGSMEYTALTEHSDLRELYTIVSHGKNAPPDKIEPPNEIMEFITDIDERVFLDRILERDFPSTAPILVSDVFRAANAAKVTDGYLKIIAAEPHGTLSDEKEVRRLRTLAMATITAIRNTKRSPNGATFTRYSGAHALTEKKLPSHTVKFTTSLYQIANAQTTWHEEIYGDSPATRKEIINRTATLLLAAILQEK